MNYAGLMENTMLGLKSDMNAFSANFENNPTVSYEWLKSLQTNYAYDFYIFDNDVPFRFSHDTKSQEQIQFANQLREYAQNNIKVRLNIYSAEHEEFVYSKQGEDYHVGLIEILIENVRCEIYVVHSLNDIYRQFKLLVLRFSIIIFLSSIAMFLFSGFYTKKLLAPIRESQEKQSQFIAAASHEIRNPVNTILSSLKAMEKCSEQQRMEFADIAKKEGNRLARLTNDLLTLTRNDNHTFQVILGSAELDTIMIDCYEAYSAAASNKHIELKIELPENTVYAENVDGERIKQIILILLDNAISYTQAGGTVILKYSETLKMHIIEVIDNGIGISDSDKPNIFDRFYRADKSRESKSHCGLGLCIAKELVELHHGKISIKDTSGGGTTFSLILKK